MAGKISLMPAAGPLDGTELAEIVQGGVNKKVTTASLAQTPIHETLAPAAGTITDFVLPGTQDYVYDIDTSLGDVEIDGTVAERDGQKVTYCNTGANLLKIGINLGTAMNRVRANGAGPIVILQNDALTFQYIEDILRWIVR